MTSHTNTEPRRGSFRRRISMGATLALIAGVLGVVGIASSAKAHTGDLKVTAVCNTATGNYDLTATLTTSSVPNGVTGSSKWRIGTTSFQGTPGSDAGMDRGPVSSTGNTTFTLGSWTLPGTTTGLGPWVYAYTKWSNGTKRGSDGRLLSQLKGDCKPQEEPKVTICHRTASYSNPYVVITVARSAVDGVAGNSGNQPDHYGEHQGPIFYPSIPQHTEWGDIIPPVAGAHNGYNWTAEGQAVYNNGCVLPDKKVTPASYTVTPETCTEPGKLSIPAQPAGVIVKVNNNTVNPPWSTSTPGTYNLAYSAAQYHQLTTDPSGTAVVKDKLDPNTNPDCRPDAPQPKREERPQTGSPNCEALTYDTWKEERFSSVVWDPQTKTWKHVWSDNWTEVQGSRVTKDVTDPQLCDMGLTLTATASCGTATVTLRNRSPWIYPVSYRETMQGDPVPTVGSPDTTGPYGPVVDNRGSAPNDQTKSKTFAYPEDSGTRVLYYAVRAGTEDDLWKGKPAGELKSIVVETDCEPNKVPLPAEQTPADKCNAPGVTNNVVWAAPLPTSTEAITWTQSADGTTRTASYNDPNGVWEDGTTGPKVWTLPADSGELCPTTPPPPPPPNPPTCPPGPQTDLNGNGVIEPPQECVAPPVPPKKFNPTAKITSSCVTAQWGEAVAVLNNKKSDKRKARFVIVKPGRDKIVKVKAGDKKRVNLTGLRVGSVLKVKLGGDVLDKTRVPKGCEKPEPPNTGFRTIALKVLDKVAFWKRNTTA